MKQSTADHYNAIARGEKTVEEALAPLFNQVLADIAKPVMRLPELTPEEMQIGDMTEDRR